MSELELVRAALMEALGEERLDWLEEACRLVRGAVAFRLKQKVHDTSTVGARIRTAREALGMTQHQLAARLGTHPRTVWRWERGLDNVPARRVRPLCQALRVSVAWLSMQSEEGGPAVRQEPVREKQASYLAMKRAQVEWRKARDEARKRNEAARARLERAETEPPEERKRSDV